MIFETQTPLLHFLNLKLIIMKRIITLTIIVIFSMHSYAQNLGSLAQKAGIVNQLMKSADIDKTKALGGAGALFGMAKENLNADDFSSVTNAVPEMSQMLDAVPALGGKTSTFAAAATSLAGMPKVLAVFDKLGISQDKVSLFTPILINYVEKKGGKLLSDKLAKSFQ